MLLWQVLQELAQDDEKGSLSLVSADLRRVERVHQGLMAAGLSRK